VLTKQLVSAAFGGRGGGGLTGIDCHCGDASLWPDLQRGHEHGENG